MGMNRRDFIKYCWLELRPFYSQPSLNPLPMPKRNWEESRFHAIRRDLSKGFPVSVNSALRDAGSLVFWKAIAWLRLVEIPGIPIVLENYVQEALQG